MNGHSSASPTTSTSWPPPRRNIQTTPADPNPTNRHLPPGCARADRHHPTDPNPQPHKPAGPFHLPKPCPNTPLHRQTIPSAPLLGQAPRSGYGVEPPGGLFVATHGRHRDAVLVSAASAQQGLQGLGVESSFPELSKSAYALSDYFRHLGLWRAARLSGFLAPLRHRKVMDSAVDTLRAVLCGENWARAERRFREHPESPASLESLVALVDKRTGFGSVLLRDRLKAGVTTGHTSDWFVNVAARKNVCRDRDLSDFALRLADDKPLVVAKVADNPGLEHLLAKLTSNPAILRAARLLTLLRNSPSGDNADATRLNGYSK